MKNIYNFILFGAFSLLAVTSCSRKKDKFINRSWHSLNTKYNILYNGNIALEAGKMTINSSYSDNYWKILPVERLQSIDDVFPKENLNDKDKKQLIEKLNLYLKDSQRRELKISDDLYTANKDFIVLHGFVDDGTAFSVLTLLREYKNYKVKDEVYIISAEDYKVIQMKKQFDDWKKLNKK